MTQLPLSMRKGSAAAAALLLFAAGVQLPAIAHAQHGHHGAHGPAKSECTAAVLKCATKVTPAIGPDGRLSIVFAAAGQLLVSSSEDDGRTFTDPVVVYAGTLQTDWGPDARPKIVVARDGSIHVAFAIFKDKRFNGQVFQTRSIDGGRTFAPSEPITDVQESQRFEALGIDPDGRPFAAWLDKRNRAPARARGETYNGAALAFSWLGGDARFAPATLAKDNTCECCRIGIAFVAAGRPVILFRNIFDGSIRDHAVIAFESPTTPGPIRRVSHDEWKTDACPHHGPSIAVGSESTLHVAWFTAGSARKGLFYASSNDLGATFSTPMPFGEPSRVPSRPAVLAVGERVHLVWKEFDGDVTTLVALSSRDSGATWSLPKTVASTKADSDSPLLIARGDRVFVSWMSALGGYHLITLEAGS